MTDRVRLLAWIYIVMCGGFIAVGLVLSLGLLMSGDPSSRNALNVLGWGFFWLSLAYFLPGLLGGLGLLRRRPWARVVIIILSAIVLLFFPIGTVLGGYGLWVLLESNSKRPSDTPASDGDRDPPSAPPKSRADRRALTELLIAGASVASLMVIIIGTGYKVTRTTGSPISDVMYFGAIGLLILIIVVAAREYRSRNNATSAADKAYWDDVKRRTEEQRHADEERRHRLAILNADPVRRTYAERIERGEEWSDAQIEYDLDPGILATCDHLKPLERELRSTEIAMRLQSGSTVSANCRVEPQVLRDRYELAPSVAYGEPTTTNGDFEAPLPAVIACVACTSAIEVVHPQDATADTPVFPLGAAQSVDAPYTGDPTNRVAEFRREVLSLARRLGASSDMIPSYHWSYGNGLPHIKIDGDTYYYVLTERGEEFERFATKSLDEILYRVATDLSFKVALESTRDCQKPGEDYRRALFPEQLELLGRLNRDWRARCAAEHQQTLAAHPFVDEK